MPLILGDRVDYVVLEYIDDMQLIFLVRHILKLIGIENYQTYRGVKGLIQTFISTKGFNIQDVYYLVDRINQFLVERNIHRCRVYQVKMFQKSIIL